MNDDALKLELENLESVLCDPDGNVCLRYASKADRDIVGNALYVFRTAIKKAQPAVPLTDEDLELCRQWFGSVQDTNKKYLTAQDYVLAEKLYLHAGMCVPDGIKQAVHGITKGSEA